MMNDPVKYSCLDRPDHPDWGRLIPLFSRMYRQMDEMGLALGLCEGGAEKWMKTARNTAGKFGVAFLAMEQDTPVGFAHGLIKFLPDYLGGFAVGSITHVYVDDRARRSGIGTRLVNELENWFRQKKIHSIELQVISGNPAGKIFWESLGYAEELRQFRKI